MANSWSTQQDSIFTWFKSGKGNLVVRARAGTGKTTTIIEGVNRAPESRILLAAFNKKIAQELTHRITNSRAEAKTLHGVGFSCVLRNWQGVKVDEDRGMRLARQVVDDDVPDEIVLLIKKLASRCKGSVPFPSDVSDLIDEAEDADLLPEEEYEDNGWNKQFVAEKAMEAMDLACKRDGTIDFDDMVFVPLRNKWVFGRWELVVIDEAQDMNTAQLLLAQRSCKKNGRIAVVGDDRQAIYGFRGADSGSIDRLKRALNAQELGLTITYRCPRLVVEAAKLIVPDFQSAPGCDEGVISHVAREAMYQMAMPGDFILSRKNAPLAAVCLALLRRGKRVRIEGKEVGKGLIALVNKLRAKSIPDFLDRLNRWVDKETTRAEKLPESKRDAKKTLILDQAETLRVLVEGLTGMKELTARINELFADVADQGPGAFIVCSSVHKAKGLERDNVFLLEDTFSKSSHREEANIKYVAITRAKKTLTWVAEEGEAVKLNTSPSDPDGSYLYPKGLESKELQRDVSLGLFNPLTDDQAAEFIERNSPAGLVGPVDTLDRLTKKW